MIVPATLTVEYLRWIVDYDPVTGQFIWKNSRRPGHNGKRAGAVGPKCDYNYAAITFRLATGDKNFTLGRLAWFYTHGAWPAGQIKFVNGDPSDTRLSNLVDHVAKKKFKQGKPNKHRVLPLFRSSRYGITPDQYAAMLLAQKGVCAICEQPETRILRGVVQTLCIDHDHTTGKVRSLLCNACNVGIGHLRDDPVLVAKAATYLRRHRGEEFDNVVPLKLVINGDKS